MSLMSVSTTIIIMYKIKYKSFPIYLIKHNIDTPEVAI